MSDASATRPAPQDGGFGQGFWEGVREGELRVQQCDACGLLRHYPQPLCPECHGGEFHWEPLSGRGEIYSYCVAHRAFHPAWQDHVPYVIATIELEEGVRMVCDLLDVAPDVVAIGQRVRVTFREMPGQGAMPRFVLDESAS